jgi:hypothetical protein
VFAILPNKDSLIHVAVVNIIKQLLESLCNKYWLHFLHIFTLKRTFMFGYYNDSFEISRLHGEPDYKGI